MHNHAVTAAAKRKFYRGGFGDFTPDEADAVPTSWALINILAAAASVGALAAVGLRAS